MIFDTQTLDAKKLTLDDPSQDTYEELKNAGLLDLPEGTPLVAVSSGHGIKIWNPAV